MTSPAQHAATVREALTAWGNRLNKYGTQEQTLAALDALQAQAEAALDREAGTSDALDEMRAERDRWREAAEQYKADRDEYDALLGRKMAERDRLAARVTELETALREIDNEDLTDELAAAEFKRVARAALDKDTQ